MRLARTYINYKLKNLFCQLIEIIEMQTCKLYYKSNNSWSKKKKKKKKTRKKKRGIYDKTRRQQQCNNGKKWEKIKEGFQLIGI